MAWLVSVCCDELINSEWSDYEGDDDADYERDDRATTSHGATSSRTDADEAAAAARGCAASSSSRDAARSSGNQGGRPLAVEVDTDLIAWLCEEGYSIREIAEYLLWRCRATPQLEITQQARCTTTAA